MKWFLPATPLSIPRVLNREIAVMMEDWARNTERQLRIQALRGFKIDLPHSFIREPVSKELDDWFRHASSRLMRDKDAFFKEREALKLAKLKSWLTFLGVAGALIGVIITEKQRRRDVIRSTLSSELQDRFRLLLEIDKDSLAVVRHVDQLVSSNRAVLTGSPYLSETLNGLVPLKGYTFDGEEITKDNWRPEGAAVVELDRCDVIFALSSRSEPHLNAYASVLDDTAKIHERPLQYDYVEDLFLQIADLFSRFEDAATTLETQRSLLLHSEEWLEDVLDQSLLRPLGSESFPPNIVRLAKSIAAVETDTAKYAKERPLFAAEIAAIHAFFQASDKRYGSHSLKFLKRIEPDFQLLEWTDNHQDTTKKAYQERIGLL